MRFTRLRLLAVTLVTSLGLGGSAPAVTVWGIDIDDNLFSFDSANPQAIESARFVTGLAANETLVGIDFRPSTSALYGLGSLANLYRIDTSTGAATLVGSGLGASLSGTAFGFDFNPTVDRIRLVSDTDVNLRLNPDTGAIAVTDPSLAYASGDPNAGRNPSIVGSAYTNSFPGSQTTVLYGIDSVLDVLVTQNPANAGTLNTIGGLGVDITNLTGFDIFNSNNRALASFQTGPGGTSELYKIDLATGDAVRVSGIGGGLFVRDISTSIVPEPTTLALLAIGLSGLAAAGRGRRPSA